MLQGIVVTVFCACLLGCLGCSGKPTPPRFYDHGERAPQPYDPSKIAQSPKELPGREADPFALQAARYSLEPKTEYEPLTSVFDDPAKEILGSKDLPATAELLRTIATATPEYHDELIVLVADAESIDAAHLILVARAAYFNDALRARMEEIAATLARRPDPLSQLQREAIVRNLKRGREFGGGTLTMLAEGLGKVKGLTPAAGLEILGELFAGAVDDNGSASAAFEALVERVGDQMTLAQRLELARLARAKRAYAFAGETALAWFAESPDRSSSTLLKLVTGDQPYPRGGDLDALIAGGASQLSSASVEDVRSLVRLLSADDAIVDTTATLIESLGQELSPADLCAIAGGIRAGKQRDAVLIGGIERIKSADAAGAREILSLFYLPENQKSAASTLKRKEPTKKRT